MNLAHFISIDIGALHALSFNNPGPMFVCPQDLYQPCCSLILSSNLYSEEHSWKCMCRKSVSEIRVMHGHPEDKPKLYSLWVMSVTSSRFLAIYQWQFCIHTYWLVPPTEQVHLWMVIVVKCTETEMSTFYFDHCSPHPWVWLESQCWYIYIYLYLSQVNEVCREMCKHEDEIPFQLHVVHARRLVMEHYISTRTQS